jgi:hypothetical protein
VGSELDEARKGNRLSKSVLLACLSPLSALSPVLKLLRGDT